MGAVDVERQKPNVLRMKILGAEVRAVESGAHTLKDAMNEALRDWVSNVSDTFYCIGTVAGPHPYPAMVRDFQSIIGREAREQLHAAEGRLPDSLIACIGGGSNAMIAVPVPNAEKGLSADAVAGAARATGLSATSRDNLTDALEAARKLDLDPPPRILITGSLYLAGEVLRENGTLPA